MLRIGGAFEVACGMLRKPPNEPFTAYGAQSGPIAYRARQGPMGPMGPSPGRIQNRVPAWAGTGPGQGLYGSGPGPGRVQARVVGLDPNC